MKYLLEIYCVLDSVLDSGEIAGNRTVLVPKNLGAYRIEVEKDENQANNQQGHKGKTICKLLKSDEGRECRILRRVRNTCI